MNKSQTVFRRLGAAALSLLLLLCLTACGSEPSVPTDTSAAATTASAAITTEPTSSAATTVAPTTAATTKKTTKKTTAGRAEAFDLSKIPAFSGKPYVALNNNEPTFDKQTGTVKSYETYSPLDKLGRCGEAMACVGRDLMPTEERGSIGSVKPSGWHTVKYDCVDGKYLYNRCHLIGYQLSGENANERNLITGTRYLNVEGMLPFENMVADYVKETGNHVLYRVIPVFAGSDLVARGVRMEAYSVEDNGDGVCFHVFCYNNQPQVEISYADGSSRLTGTTQKTTLKTTKKTAAKTTQKTTAKKTTVRQTTPAPPVSVGYVANTNTKKFHTRSCRYVNDIAAQNRWDTDLSRDELIRQGYKPCKVCHP